MMPWSPRGAYRWLAVVLLAAMVLVPQAMAWADVSPPATHAANHHHTPGAPDQPLHDDCCDLCLTSCIACAGMIGGATARFHSRTAPWVTPAAASRVARVLATFDQDRLPFPLGPPSPRV